MTIFAILHLKTIVDTECAKIVQLIIGSGGLN